MDSTNRKDMIDHLYEYNECEIDSWYDQHKEEFPMVVEKYNKYQKNKKEQDIVDQVKDKMVLDFYNKRNMVKNNELLESE